MEIGTAEAGHRRTDSSVPPMLADARERNAAFPSLHPAPPGLPPDQAWPGAVNIPVLHRGAGRLRETSRMHGNKLQ